MAGQEQEPLPGHVETAGGVGQVHLPVGECEEREAQENIFYAPPVFTRQEASRSK